MAGPEERYGRGNETAAEIAEDDASADAAAPRWNKTAGKGGGAMSDGDRATAAMASRHDRFAGSAVGVGADGAVGEGEVAELLIDGQEEVFARTEVERGRIEHHAGEDSSPAQGGSRRDG